MNYEIIIRNRFNIEVAKSSGVGECHLFYHDNYLVGDRIIIKGSKLNTFVVLKIDDGMESSIVYMTKRQFEYEIPFFEKHDSYPAQSFQGSSHVISIRDATKAEWECYRNLSFNCADQHQCYGLFPHAHANVETRGESVFAARNAIDGYVLTDFHGCWPYESWGINRQDDAWLQVDFGRMVSIDRLDLFLRADFPHDNWWKDITFEFSDETSIIVHPVKSGKRQTFAIEPRKISWIRMMNLIKAEEESPFPALTQIEIYGTEAHIG
jgi:hypothetical protein